MKNFIMRYYIIAHNNEVAENVTAIAVKNDLELVSQTIPPDFLEHKEASLVVIIAIILFGTAFAEITYAMY